MLRLKRPLGFGDVVEVAEFFGIPRAVVRQKAASGEWPSYVIAGRRVFDVDEIVALLASGRCGHRDVPIRAQ